MHQVVTPTPARSPRQRRSRRRRYIIFGAIGLILLWIIVGSIMGKREKPIPVTTEKAVRKTILQTVSATGKIQPEVEVKISPEVAGEIIELPVQDGMAGEKGGPLVKNKTQSFKGAVEQQENPVNAAEGAKLQQKKTKIEKK